MTQSRQPEVPSQVPPDALDAMYRLFRDYFDLAERKRRWSIAADIPWKDANSALNPAIADIVETFCIVELYLPDYLSKLIPQVRANRPRAWMLANWGYEECKHSMALEDWLLKSRVRTDEQVADMHERVFEHEWNLPYDNACGMLCYTAFQELATRIHYTRLADIVRSEGGCPALEKVLSLVAIDEAAHADFFRKMLAIYLEFDRPGTIDQMRHVANTFNMPAVHMLSDSRKRVGEIRDWHIFDEMLFIEQVLDPVIGKLGVTRAELRRKKPREHVLVG